MVHKSGQSTNTDDKDLILIKGDAGSGSPRVFLSGVTGFIGSHVLGRILEQEGRVRVLTLPEAVKDLRYRDRLEITVGSLADEELLTEGLQGIETVYHMAALLPGIPYADQMKVNVHGTENLLRACGRAGKVRRFIFISSVAVYGGAFNPRSWPMNESTPLRPGDTENLRNYGRSKVAAESLVRRYAADAGFDYTIVRPSTCYGLGSPAAESMVRRTLTDPRAGSGPGAGISMQMIHVQDLAKGIVDAGTLQEGKNEIFNLAGAEVTTYRDIAMLIGRLAGKTDWTTSWGDRSVVWRRYILMYDIARAEQMLGFIPTVTLQEGFAEMVEALNNESLESREAGPVPEYFS